MPFMVNVFVVDDCVEMLLERRRVCYQVATAALQRSVQFLLRSEHSLSDLLVGCLIGYVE